MNTICSIHHKKLFTWHISFLWLLYITFIQVRLVHRKVHVTTFILYIYISLYMCVCNKINPVIFHLGLNYSYIYLFAEYQHRMNIPSRIECGESSIPTAVV